MKKILLISLSLVFLMNFSACSNSEKNNSDSNVDKRQKNSQKINSEQNNNSQKSSERKLLAETDEKKSNSSLSEETLKKNIINC